MKDASISELCVMSRALERAMRAIPNKPRSDIATRDLAEGVLAAATEGISDEAILAERALRRVGISLEAE